MRVFFLGCFACALACSGGSGEESSSASGAPTVLEQLVASPDVPASTSLAGQSRPLSSAPELADGQLVVPPDFKTLPEVAALWSRSDLTGAPAVVDGTVVSAGAAGFIALDAATGEVRWATAGAGGSVRGGCEGMVLLRSAERLRGVHAASGEVRWARAQHAADAPLAEESSGIRAFGCHVALLRRGADGPRLARGPGRVMLLDVRTGEEREVARCTRVCELQDLTETHLLYTFPGDDTGRWVRLADGDEREMPARTRYVVAGEPPIALTAELDGTTRAVAVATAERDEEDEDDENDEETADVWRRAETLRGWQRRSGDVLLYRDELRGEPGFVRIHALDLRTGEDRWTVRLRERRLWTDAEVALSPDRSRIALLTGDDPRLLVHLEAATGSLRSMQLAHRFGRMRLAVAGEHAVMVGEDGAAVVRLDREEPPPRDATPLDDDIARARTLAAGDEEATPATRYADYPSTAAEAVAYLSALAPLLVDDLVERVTSAAPADARQALLPLASDHRPVVERAREAALARTAVVDPNRELVSLRRAAAETYRGELPASLALDLAGSAAETFDRAARGAAVARASGQPCDGERDSAPCVEQALRLEAVTLTRDLLDARSPSPEPLALLRERVAQHASRAPTCEPAGRDAIWDAALRHLFELALLPTEVIVADGMECVSFGTAGGALTVVSEADRPPIAGFGQDQVPFHELQPPADPDAAQLEAQGLAAEPGIRAVSHRVFRGPRDGSRGTLYLQRIGGQWRVIGGGGT